MAKRKLEEHLDPKRFAKIAQPIRLLPAAYPEVIFDLETSLGGFKGDLLWVLCAVIKPVRQAPLVYRIDQFSPKTNQPFDDERQLLEAVTEILENSTLVITYNGSKFDIPTLKTRRLLHGMRPSSVFAHLDLLQVIRQERLTFHSKAQAVIMRQLAAWRKVEFEEQLWLKAMRGDKAALDYIVERCISDCRGLEQLYFALKRRVRRWKAETV